MDIEKSYFIVYEYRIRRHKRTNEILEQCWEAVAEVDSYDDAIGMINESNHAIMRVREYQYKTHYISPRPDDVCKFIYNET